MRSRLRELAHVRLFRNVTMWRMPHNEQKKATKARFCERSMANCAEGSEAKESGEGALLRKKHGVERIAAMQIKTRVFGEVTIDDEKIIHFPGGIIGFPDLQDFALIHDEEKGTDTIHWLQSIQEPAFAMPVMDPLIVCPDYNPEVDDELLNSIGDIQPDELLVMVTVTVPKEIEKMTVNLKGPIVINAAERLATQVIVEGEGYVVKFPIYDILNQNKKKAGE